MCLRVEELYSSHQNRRAWFKCEWLRGWECKRIKPGLNLGDCCGTIFACLPSLSLVSGYPRGYPPLLFFPYSLAPLIIATFALFLMVPLNRQTWESCEILCYTPFPLSGLPCFLCSWTIWQYPWLYPWEIFDCEKAKVYGVSLVHGMA